MAWLSRNDFTNSDKLYSSALNNLANDDRNWGGNVNGGGWTLSNVSLSGASIYGGVSVGLGALPSGSGNVLNAQSFQATTTNGDVLLTRLARIGTGSSWDTAFWQIGRWVDGATEIAAIEYGPYSIAIRAQGSQRLIVTNTGVGIGTASPGSRLHVHDGDILVSTAADAQRGFLVTPDAVNKRAYLFTSGNNAGHAGFLHLYNGSGNATAAQIVMFDAAGTLVNLIGNSGYTYFNGGNCGIGTTTPSQALTVSRGYGVQTALYLLQSGVAAAYVGSKATDTALYITNAYYGGALGDGAYSILLDRDGNVSIGGGNSLQGRLNVAKNAPGGMGGTLALQNLGGAAEDQTAIVFWSGAQSRARIISTAHGADGYAGTLEFCTGLDTQVERMRIAGTGQVGIGKTNPQYTLDVSGSINVSSGSYLLNGTPHLATLAAGADDLPPNGGLNIWLDEDQGRLAVRYRNAAGALRTAYIPIE